MLEILYVTDRNARFVINLTDTDHYKSSALKILHLENIRVSGLGNDITNWENLEYFYLSHAHFNNLPSEFKNNSKKISFFALEDCYLQELPYICDMTNLRALKIISSLSATQLTSILPQCIVNLELLQSIIFQYSRIDTLPIGIFSMPSMKEIGFVHSYDISALTLLGMISNTLNNGEQFTWNKNPIHIIHLQIAAFVMICICQKHHTFTIIWIILIC